MQKVCNRCNVVFEKEICEAYLYGSYARGDFHEESDIDILIIVDESPENLSTYRKQLAKICSDLGLAQYKIAGGWSCRPMALGYRSVLPIF